MLTYATIFYILLAMQPSLCLILHNIRSAHNVGSIFRTADGLGVTSLFLTGYTPYPQQQHDQRLPHIAQRNQQAIHKTALGAETTVPWQYQADITQVIADLRQQNYCLVALEQTPQAQPLQNFRAAADQPLALTLGNELTGLDNDVLQAHQSAVEIPMFGHKESYNVAVSAAIALYHLRYHCYN